MLGFEMLDESKQLMMYRFGILVVFFTLGYITDSPRLCAAGIITIIVVHIVYKIFETKEGDE